MILCFCVCSFILQLIIVSKLDKLLNSRTIKVKIDGDKVDVEE